MNHKFLTFLTFGVLTLVVFIFFSLQVRPIDLSIPEADVSTLSLTEPTVTFVNPSRGAENPLITIIEFSDFECAACKTIATPIEIAVVTYPEKVRHVWKNLPNESLHQFATPAAIAAHCAHRQDMFWEYHDQLFARQSYLSESQFTQIAVDIGLDVQDFQFCYDQRDTLPIVKKDYEEGIALGISSTPTIYIGDEVFTGAISSERLLAEIEQQLQALDLEE